jgi:hypothetical protein
MYKHSLIACHTDYLPSDIQAAPAVGNIQSIIILAAFAGCGTMEMVGGYPIVRGGNLQVSFREHPLLDPVAVFQSFPGINTYRL